MVFTATDGTQFEDRNEWRKYEFETNYTFKNKEGETLMKLPGSIQGQPFDIADLNNCTVMLLDHSDQVQIDNVTNCRIFIGPCSESVFIRNCSNCLFAVACKQLRTRDCSSVDFYLYSMTDPIIETSSGMQFAAFNGAYNGIHQHFMNAGLDPQNNHWSQVYDFNDPDKSGKNWSLIKPDESMGPWSIPLDDYMPDVAALGPCDNPVPSDAEPQYPDASQTGSGSDGIQSFSFDTSQEQATQMMQDNVQVDTEGGSNSASGTDYDPFGAVPPADSFTDTAAAPPTPVDSSIAAAPLSAGSTSNAFEAEEPKSYPALEEFQKEFDAEVTRKKEKEVVMIKDTKSKAEEDLDTYYAQRTDRLAHRAATNREQEEEKIKMQKVLKEEASDKPWARVADLVDMNMSKRKKAEGNAENEDLSRMRSILVQLKNNGGLEIQAENA